MQFTFHVEQLLRLFLGELVDGDPCPEREHLGDGFLVDLVEEVHSGCLDLGFLLRLFLEQALFLIAQLAGFLEALFLDGTLLGLLHLGEALFDAFEVGRGLHALDAQARTSLVDEVDGLVREVTIRDVTIRKVCGSNQCLIGDRYPVVGLVPVAQTLEDLDGVGKRGLVHLHRLEAALQGGVLLEVLSVLVERGGTDGLQFAPSEHRLEDARRIDCPFCGTGTDERVNLVDEQDDVSAGADLLEHLFQAFLEIAAIPRAGNECAEVQRVQLLAAQGVGHVARDDLLGETLDDRGLAHPGLTDEHGVVFGAA
ncbi:unannotated protein [freshwater metagenome]|uniref:Unannotated protein n=1 Tax=freshwater metagenome TaxID=449393 RepID=A0A6J7USV3_9ZZZZ